MFQSVKIIYDSSSSIDRRKEIGIEVKKCNRIEKTYNQAIDTDAGTAWFDNQR